MRPPLVILAGGKGTRLRSVTKDSVPKPMVDIFGKPFLYWLIRHYVQQGFVEIDVCVGHKADLIENYPWPWRLRLIPDGDVEPEYKDFAVDVATWNGERGAWVVNGDTYIPAPLPHLNSVLWASNKPIVMVHSSVDAGAQFVSNKPGLVKVEDAGIFYDIGTPPGLKAFKQYFLTHCKNLID